MILALVMAIASAGPWVQPAGETYAKIELAGFTGLSKATLEPNEFIYSDVRAQAYAELGLPADFQVTVFAPVVLAINRNEAERFTGFTGGDFELGLTRALTNKPLSVELRARFPSYFQVARKRAIELGNGVGENLPIPGEAAFGLAAWVHYGTGIRSGRGWAQGSLGYRYRFDNRSDAVVFDGVVGLTPAFGWVGVGVGGVVNFRDDSLSQQFVAIRGIAAYRLAESVHLEANIMGLPTAGGSGTSVGLGAGLGISYRGRVFGGS